MTDPFDLASNLVKGAQMHPSKSLSDRLNAVLDRVLPKDAPRHPSPYVFDVTGDGRQTLQITVNRDTGERIGVVGRTKADLIDQLEARFPA